MHQIIIFASGTGTNAKAILDYFSQHPGVQVACIVCNKPQAGVLNIAAAYGIPTLLIDRAGFDTPQTLDRIKQYNPGLIVLAGFLWKIPQNIIAAFPHSIINIHPALLPKYGGKGMYGDRVHEAVIANGEKESGITIHYVNEHYDDGGSILQAYCTVKPDDTPRLLANRIHHLEHYYLPRTIDFLLQKADE